MVRDRDEMSVRREVRSGGMIGERVVEFGDDGLDVLLGGFVREGREVEIEGWVVRRRCDGIDEGWMLSCKKVVEGRDRWVEEGW